MKGDKNLRVLVAIPLLFVLGCLFISSGDSDDYIDEEFMQPVNKDTIWLEKFLK